MNLMLFTIKKTIKQIMFSRRNNILRESMYTNALCQHSFHYHRKSNFSSPSVSILNSEENLQKEKF